jgi:hypothetical protein
MTHEELVKERTPVWMALSEFYLDTKLEEDDIEQIVRVCLKSPYSIDELKLIDRFELWPFLQANLIGGAGVWAGFDENWLVSRASAYLSRRGWANFIISALHKFYTRRYWRKFDMIYEKIIR